MARRPKNRTFQPFIDWIKATPPRNRTHPVGAEIGVKNGRTAAGLLRAIPNLELFVIDPWHSSGDSQEYGYDDDLRKQHQWNMLHATHDFWHRRHVLAMDSSSAARLIGREHLDFVILDADHSAEAIEKDVDRWLQRVCASPHGWCGGRHMLTKIEPDGNGGGTARGKASVFLGIERFMQSEFGPSHDLEVDGTSWRLTWKTDD